MARVADVHEVSGLTRILPVGKLRYVKQSSPDDALCSIGGSGSVRYYAFKIEAVHLFELRLYLSL